MCKTGIKLDAHRNASNQLTIDFAKIEVNMYPQITKAIVDHFNLNPSNEIIEGPNEVFQDYKLDNLIVGLEWDIWSGYIVNAKNIESEPLAKEIARFIKEKITKNPICQAK